MILRPVCTLGARMPARPYAGFRLGCLRRLVAGNRPHPRHRGTLGAKSGLTRRRSLEGMGATDSVNDIRTAIRELSLRADLARKEGRPDDAAEIDQRVESYRGKLAERP